MLVFLFFTDFPQWFWCPQKSLWQTEQVTSFSFYSRFGHFAFCYCISLCL